MKCAVFLKQRKQFRGAFCLCLKHNAPRFVFFIRNQCALLLIKVCNTGYKVVRLFMVHSLWLWLCMNSLPKFGGDNGPWVYERIMVVTCDNVIPKEKMFECMQLINGLRIETPVHIGDVLLPDVFGANVVATENID